MAGLILTPTHTVTLKGSPDVVLKRKGGSITLDARQAPHIQARVTIATPSLSTMALLDPRLNKRVEIAVNVTGYPSGTQTRTFNLGLRRRGAPQADGTVELELASDEALLLDYAPTADDITPRSSASSLRSVINYVLNKVTTGWALAGTPSTDADATRYWPVTNVITNPSIELDLFNWSQGTNSFGMDRILMSGIGKSAHSGSYSVGFSAAAGGDANILPTELPTDTTTYPVNPGDWWVWSFYIQSGATARSARAAIQWWSADGTVLSSTSFGTTSTTSTSAWQRRYVIAQVPRGASHMVPYVNTLANTAGNLHYVDSALLYQGDELIDTFHGGTSDGGGYAYDWSAAADASTSTRTPTVEVAKDSLTWKAGQSAYDFLEPLMQRHGLRLVGDESRAWTLRNSDYAAAAGNLDIRYGINMYDGTDEITREDESWFDAAVAEYEWTDDEGIAQRKLDTYALTTPWTKLMHFHKDSAYPGPGFAQYAVLRAKGRGREVSATTAADWRTNAEQQSVFILNGVATQTGKTDSVTFNLDDDTMTVTSRTTDTGAGAIDLLSGTINGLSGTINGL